MSDSKIFAVLLAHQGGWDEVLLIGAPIVAIVVALWIAKRRVDAAAASPDSTIGSPTTEVGDTER